MRPSRAWTVPRPRRPGQRRLPGRLRPGTIALGLALVPAEAPAQERDSAGHVVVLDSVVVTAHRREQRLRDAPVSVALVPGRRLQELGAADLLGLAASVPNLVVEEGSQGAAIVMRGIGNNGGTNLGFESPVGTFVDGVYHGRGNHAWLPYLDVERVEVLRGPQSTFFGMNTVAGAVSVTSGRPTEHPSGSLRLFHDPVHRRSGVDGFVSGPLGARASGRAAFSKTRHDGYLRNTFQDRNTNGNDDAGGRLTLRWTPAARLALTGKVERITRFQNGLSRQVIVPTTDEDALRRMLAADPRATFRPDGRTSHGEEFRDVRSDALVLTATYAMPGATLTSVTARTDFDAFSHIDIDATALPVGAIRAREEFGQLSQELWLASDATGRVDYVAGASFHRSDLTSNRLLDFALGHYVTAFAGTPQGELQTYAGNLYQDGWTVSAFAAGGWKVRDDLRVYGGLRASRAGKRGRSFFDWLVPGTDDPTDVLDPGSEAFAVADFVFHDVFRIVRHTDRGRYDETVLLPDFGVQWHAVPTVMLYASRSRGHKSGGFNDRDNRAVNFSFGPESSTSYEAGLRGTLPSGSATGSVTLFRTHFHDMQVSVFDLKNLVFIVENAARATSQGVEMDGTWRVGPGLTLDGSLGWLQRARFDEFLVPCVPDPEEPECVDRPGGAVRDEGGEPLNTPALFLAASAQYGRALGSALRLSGRLGVSHRGGSADVVNQTGSISSVAFWNGRVALEWNDRWTAAAVGTNLTDERFVATRTAQLFAGSFQGEVHPPRAVTVELSYSF